MNPCYLQSISRFVLQLSSLLCLAGLPAAAGGATHPTLVKVESANCLACHEDLVEFQAVIHSPVEDGCTLCHSFSKTDEGTIVELTESEPSLCLMCHDDLEQAAALELEAPHFPVEDSCLSCHDPHASDEARLLLAGRPKLCAECHDLEDLNSAHSIPVSRTTCTTCHLPHGSDVEGMLLTANQHVPFSEGSCDGCHRPSRGSKVHLRGEVGEICAACHGDFEAPKSGSFHLVVKQGKCTSCHNPHLARETHLLNNSGQALCASCHPEVVASAKGAGGHAAAADGCDTCHLPHVSDHGGLLVAPSSSICADCHDYEDASLVEKHLGATMSSIDCLTCHDPHGSANQHLIASQSLHPPFEEGCDLCHENGVDGLMEGGGVELCAVCHDVAASVGDFAVPHLALEMAVCTDCHSPHASRNRRLLLAPGGEVCTQCHSDQEQVEDWHVHAIVDTWGCHGCHQPHGGDNPTLLRSTGNSLCLECHLKSGGLNLQGDGPLGDFVASNRNNWHGVELNAELTAGHPLPDHPVAGIVPKKRGEFPEELIGTEVMCISCHDPHQAPTSTLFRNGASDEAELCKECHQK